MEPQTSNALGFDDIIGRISQATTIQTIFGTQIKSIIRTPRNTFHQIVSIQPRIFPKNTVIDDIKRTLSYEALLSGQIWKADYQFSFGPQSAVKFTLPIFRNLGSFDFSSSISLKPTIVARMELQPKIGNISLSLATENHFKSNGIEFSASTNIRSFNIGTKVEQSVGNASNIMSITTCGLLTRGMRNYGFILNYYDHFSLFLSGTYTIMNQNGTASIAGVSMKTSIFGIQKIATDDIRLAFHRVYQMSTISAFVNTQLATGVYWTRFIRENLNLSFSFCADHLHSVYKYGIGIDLL